MITALPVVRMKYDWMCQTVTFVAIFPCANVIASFLGHRCRWDWGKGSSQSCAAGWFLRFLLVNLKCSLQRFVRSRTGVDLSMDVFLHRVNGGPTRVFAPKFPKPMNEGWWLVVGMTGYSSAKATPLNGQARFRCPSHLDFAVSLRMVCFAEQFSPRDELLALKRTLFTGKTTASLSLRVNDLRVAIAKLASVAHVDNVNPLISGPSRVGHVSLFVVSDVR